MPNKFLNKMLGPRTPNGHKAVLATAQYLAPRPTRALLALTNRRIFHSQIFLKMKSLLLICNTLPNTPQPQIDFPFDLI